MRRPSTCVRSWLVVGPVLTLALVACMGGSDEGEAEASANDGTTTQAQPASLSPPTDLTAANDGLGIVVSWAAPQDDLEAERYSVYRDGSFFRTVLAPEVSFTDTDVAPGRAYSYAVEARAGDLVSERATVEAKAPTPALRAARVQGTFNVRTKELSSSGYSDFRAAPLGWRFTPRCGEGPCDVRWRDLQQKRLTAVFKRQGARYTGSYTGFFYVLCSGVRTTSSVSVRFTVEAARALGGEWRATVLVGRLSQSEAAQLGCAASRASISLRARLVF